MLKLWNALEHEVRFGGKPGQTTQRCVLLIAKLLFWVIDSAYISRQDVAVRNSFVAFFGLEGK